MASGDGKPGGPDVISKERVEEMRHLARKGDYPLGWARYNPSDHSLTRTGSMSGTCAYIDYRENGLSFVLITNTSSYKGASFTNSIGRVIRDAMVRVKEWPTDRDMFVAVPQTAVDSLAE